MAETKDVKIVKADAVICPVNKEVRLATGCKGCDFYQGTNGDVTAIKCKDIS